MPSARNHRVRTCLWRYRATLCALLILPAAFALLHSRIGPEPRCSLPDSEAHIIEFSPDGRRMFTAGVKGAAIRDVATGQVLVNLADDVRNPLGAEIPFGWPRFTPDGKRLIFQIRTRKHSARPDTATVKVFDVETGRERATFDHAEQVYPQSPSHLLPAYVLSGAGSTLAFATRPDHLSGRITIWDLDRGETTATFPGFPPLAIARDGNAVAYRPERDAPLRCAIRKATSDAPETTFDSSTPALRAGGLTAIAFAPDSRSLAACAGMHCEIRELPSGKILDAPTPSVFPTFIGFGRDSHSLIFEEIEGRDPRGRIEHWDQIGESWQKKLRTDPEHYSPSSCRIITCKNDKESRWDDFPRNNSEVIISNIDLQEEIARFVDTNVHTMSLSPGGDILAFPTTRRVKAREPDAVMQFLSGRILRRRGPASASGPLEERGIRFYDASSGKVLKIVDRTASDWTPSRVKFSPDGVTLVVHSAQVGSAPLQLLADPPVELWDVLPQRPLGRIVGYSTLVTCTVLAAGSWLDRRRVRRSSPA